jgi:hypothetical protein
VSRVCRPLAGVIVNLSISESNDSAGRGFPSALINRATLEVVSALVGQGVSLIFGHDWREDGVMEAVYGFAQQVQPPIPLTAEQPQVNGGPVLWNLLPWPDKPRLSPSGSECLASTLRIESAGLPEKLIKYEKDALDKGSKSALYQYLRARGLTYLRRRLTGLSHARLCIGGRQSWSEGRYPGVIEEALISLEGRKPLYLAGVLGGATQQLIQALMGEPMPDDFCPPTKTNLYSNPPILERAAETRIDRNVNREAVWKAFHGHGIKGVAANNGLSEEQNFRLFQTTVLDEVIQIVLIGLSRASLTQRPKEPKRKPSR